MTCFSPESCKERGCIFPDRCVIRSGLPCWVFQGPSVRYTIQAATQLDAAIKLLSMLGYEAKR